jgi:hypothetical protein
MTDYNAMIRALFTAPARGMTAQPPKANLGGGMIEKLHNALDPVQAMGGYGNLAAMALPPGAPKMPKMAGNFKTTPDGKMVGYRVVNLDEKGNLVSQANSRTVLPPEGDHSAPMWVSNDAKYVQDYYYNGPWEEGAPRQALVEYEFSPANILEGNPLDAQPELSIGHGRVRSVTKLP